MTDCCESSCNSSRKHRCPINGKEYGSVSTKTILHHLNEPWKRDLEGKGYYFCSDSDCDVVYFGQDNSVISKKELRTEIGIKETAPSRTVCYCFGVSYSTAAQNKTIVSFVKDKTKQSLCSCETSNPSGRCCLKDFPKQ
jgi:YHS domain-containing protein